MSDHASPLSLVLSNFLKLRVPEHPLFACLNCPPTVGSVRRSLHLRVPERPVFMHKLPSYSWNFLAPYQMDLYFATSSVKQNASF